VLAGCGAIPPRVAYSTYSDQAAATATADQKRSYFFRHRRSVLVVSVDSEGLFEVKAAPFELTQDNNYMPLYEIVGADDLRATTQINLTYLDNTKVVHEIQVSTKDNIADMIVRLGEVVKGALPFFASGQAPVAKAGKFNPTRIDPMSPDVSQWRRDPINESACLRLRDSTVESQMTIDGFIASAAHSWVRTFPVPACATGIVDIATKCSSNLQDTKPEVSIRVTYAHPRNVLPMPLPSTGSMKMHSVCGASVAASDKQDRTDVLDYVRSALKAATEVQSALDSKAKAATKPAPAAAKP
jgi:hypothetical protein